jgi:Acyclic terpene utilisation family protein AtuA
MRIGCGAGFAADRVDAASQLLDSGPLDYLVFECLAERTIALRQLERRADPDRGFDPLLLRRLAPILGTAMANGTRIISNSGAANPLAAGRAVLRQATENGLCGLSVAVLTGDDVLSLIDWRAPALEDGEPLADHGEIVSANAYLGADALLPALGSDASVILTGRVADPSLFVAPIVHTMGWNPTDAGQLAVASLAGHLLECAGQVTGGYFADPGPKDVPGLDALGYPIAEVGADGSLVITKPVGSGGLVSTATVKEQVLYEILDPREYITPDARLDLTTVSLRDVGPDRVSVSVGPANPRPEQLKVNVGYRAGFRAEAEISYAGRGAVARARLAAEIVTKRLGGHVDQLKTDLIGIDSLHEQSISDTRAPYECRLRIAGRDADKGRAQAVAEEVEALYTNGPAGGAGIRCHVEEIIGVVSTFLPRDAVRTETTILKGGEQ